MFRFVVKRNGSRAFAPAEQLLEVITPRTNAALITPAENLCGSLTLHTASPVGGPVALEIVADGERSRFFVRTETTAQQRQLRGQIGAAYPQATLRSLEPASMPAGDPLRVGDDERVGCCALMLREGDHLPIRTFHDRELDADSGAAQVDPVLGVLRALDDLPVGWRALSQVVLVAPAPRRWARAYQRMALQNPVAAERSGRSDSGTSLASLVSLFGLGLAVLVSINAWSAWERGDWGEIVLGAAGLAGVIGIAIAVYLRFARRELHDPRLVQEKLSREACRVELRLAVIAPGHTSAAAVRNRLEQLAAAYRPYALAAGNSFVSKRVRSPALDLRVLAPVSKCALLNVRELAGLWHLPQAADEVPFVERTTARRRLPLPATVGFGRGGEGCRIGSSEHQGHNVQVVLPPGLLRRHLLAIAKTRRGKSSLMLQFVLHLMLTGTTGPGGRAAGTDRRCVILVDPHSDLATAALGLVPTERRGDVVYLDVSNHKRPFGINLLDVGLGWNRDQAVGNALRVFKREFDAFWGPRMEDAFRFALMALFEANEAICHVDPIAGRSSQHTILEVPDLLGIPRFRNSVLKKTSDPAIKHWFSSYFDPLELRHRQEIINPVQTKVHKYAGSKVARAIVGQPRSTVDFREFIAQGRIVIINLRAFEVIEDTAALVGGTLLNLAARAVSSQSTVAPDCRRGVTMAVDEFHTIPGADYEQVFGELAKYGANMMLATQTLSRLDRLTEADRTRDLRAAVFSNLDALFAFHTSAEDAEYLAEELGGGLDKQDLLELGHYQCYGRVTDVRTGERLPAFSVRLDPPPAGDTVLAEQLASESAERYGRPALQVELDLQAAADRVRGGKQEKESEPDGGQKVGAGGGRLPGGVATGGEVPRPTRPRNRQKRTAAAGRRTRSDNRVDEAPGREDSEAPAA
jgi:hypothetical protein